MYLLYKIYNFPHYLVEILIMQLKYSVFILCYFTLLGEIWAFGTIGPLGKIIIRSVRECSGADKPQGDEINFKLSLNTLNDAGDKNLDVVFENKIAIDGTMNYVADFKKFENGGWKNFYNLKGKICHDLDRYVKKLWTKLKGGLVPKLDKTCPIPPGSYKASKFEAETTDIETKQIFYGNLLSKFTLSDQKGKILFCFITEGDSQAP